jgi:phosphomevalonate kinase
MDNNRPITALAPGKLILLGEYAVLEGAPALVTAVDRYASVHVRDLQGKGEPGLFAVESPTLGVPPLHFSMDSQGKPRFDEAEPGMIEKLKFFIAAFQHGWFVLKENGLTVPACHIVLETPGFYTGTPPAKLGFGSSAALTVALLAALQALGGREEFEPRRRYHLFRAAMAAHCRVQGRTGSGIDIAAAAWGGVIHYRVPGPLQDFNNHHDSITPLPLPAGLHLLVPWTGIPASTRRLVQQVRAFKKELPGHYNRAMEEMARISAAGVRALTQEDIPAFLRAVDEYYIALERLGEAGRAPVVSNEHRRLARIARRCGAVYKPSGAGGGDCGIAFAGSAGVIQKTEAAFRRAGFHIPAIAASARGLHIKKETKVS